MAGQRGCARAAAGVVVAALMTAGAPAAAGARAAAGSPAAAGAGGVAAPAEGALPVEGAVPAAGAAGRLFYVSNRDSSSITAFTAGGDGALVPAGAPVPTGTWPRGIALAPDGHAVYVGNSLSRTVEAFAVGAGGALTPLGAAVPTGVELNPFGVALTPDGGTLFVISHPEDPDTAEGSGALQAFPVGPGGVGRPGPVVSTGVHPRTLVVSPDGRYLYVGHGNPAELQPGFVLTYAIGAGGALTPVGEAVPAGTSNGAMAITASGRFVYVPAQASGEIYGFAVGAGGRLRPIPGTPLPQPGRPVTAIVSPDGRHLYVASLDTGLVFTYLIGAAGQLTPVTTYSVGTQPDAGATSPDGRHLYVANYGSDNLSVFAIQPGGRLREIAGSPVPTGADGPAFGSIGFIPNQGPVAAFTARPRPAGTPSGFDASSAVDTDGRIARYDWDFGDGSSLRDGGPAARHTYARPGRYRVTLTVTDDEGCATRLVFTGHFALCTGSAAATARRTVTIGR